MKIKQTTKIVILVVALVSVIGVGAVSFAAWQGAPSIQASAAIGNVSIAGFDSDELTISGSLIPHDQDLEQSVGVNGTKYISVALPSASVTGNYTITVDSETAIDVRVNIGSQMTAETAINLDNFTSIAGESSYVYEGSVDGEATNNLYAVSGLYLNLILVSDSAADMNGSVDLAITIAPVVA